MFLLHAQHRHRVLAGPQHRLGLLRREVIRVEEEEWLVVVVKRMLLLLMVVITTWNTSSQSVLPKGLRMGWLLLVGNLGVLSTWMDFTCGQKLLLLLLWLWFSGLAVLSKQSGLQFRVGAQSCCCCCCSRFRRRRTKAGWLKGM